MAREGVARKPQQDKSWRTYAMVSGWLIVVTFLVCSALAGTYRPGVAFHAQSDLFERIAMVTGGVWITLLAFKAAKEKA